MRRNNRIIRYVVILLVTLAFLLGIPASVSATEPPSPPPAARPSESPGTAPSATSSSSSPYSSSSSSWSSSSPSPPSSSAAGTSGAAAVGPTVPSPRVYAGWGFDACRTPSVATMRAWLTSKYRAVGVYYAGSARACKSQPHLNRGWLRSVSAMGWRVMPVYVGLQSPCVLSAAKNKYRISSTTPGRQGTAEAREAVRRARDLGLRAGSPIYLDMEAYNTLRPACMRATLSFVRAFNREARRQSYLTGFYSSAASGIAHVARARRAGTKDMPDVIWYARWRVAPTLTREPVLPRTAWSPHRRIHQYAGNVREKHGGRQLRIDRNRLDAPVAIVD
jgi:hypothetical protein